MRIGRRNQSIFQHVFCRASIWKEFTDDIHWWLQKLTKLQVDDVFHAWCRAKSNYTGGGKIACWVNV